MIEDTYRAYLELDLEVVVQDAVFSGGRSSTETPGQFIGKSGAEVPRVGRVVGGIVSPNAARRNF